MRRTLVQLASRPLYWYAIIVLPLLLFAFFTSELEEGLPVKAPAGIVDNDHTSMSRRVGRNLDGMQLVSLTKECDSYSDAMDALRKGEIFGFFLIPENYEADLLSGRSPVISFYTNMTYFIPGTMLYKNFKTTAVYTKAGVVMNVVQSATGAQADQVMPLINPVNIQAHPIGNPWLNYAYYLASSFIPGVLQLMIFLVTAFTICDEIKRGTSVRLMRMARGSIIRAVTGKLLPQTLIWVVIAMFMEAWMYGFNHFPIYGSLFWMTVSTLLFVAASQGFSLLVCCLLPNLRLSLSVNALMGILSFSIGAFSFPVSEMYGAIGIFSWIIPVRYYFLIYITQSLDAMPLYYSRCYFAAYFAFITAPLLILWHLKRYYRRPVYEP